MKKPFIFLFLFISVAIGAILPSKAQADQDKLPFKMSITKVGCDNLPDYFEGGQGCPN